MSLLLVALVLATISAWIVLPATAWLEAHADATPTPAWSLETERDITQALRLVARR